MVQKGVGWLLKEASKEHPDEIREYVLILRYASEKLPKDKRVLKTN
jgi:3-methyladenine DNA glycosylase AlkD